MSLLLISIHIFCIMLKSMPFRRLGQVGQHPFGLLDELLQEDPRHMRLVVGVVRAVEVLEIDASENRNAS